MMQRTILIMMTIMILNTLAEILSSHYKLISKSLLFNHKWMVTNSKSLHICNNRHLQLTLKLHSSSLLSSLHGSSLQSCLHGSSLKWVSNSNHMESSSHSSNNSLMESSSRLHNNKHTATNNQLSSNNSSSEDPLKNEIFLSFIRGTKIL